MYLQSNQIKAKKTEERTIWKQSNIMGLHHEQTIEDSNYLTSTKLLIAISNVFNTKMLQKQLVTRS